MKILVCTGVLLAAAGVVTCAAASPSFSVASIRPSSGQVQFEHDGRTEVLPGSLNMRDVTVATCIKWAYGVQDSQISGPEWLQADHFDIVARADGQASAPQMKVMMQSLLAERFGLKFHRQSKELQAYAMVIAKGGHKLKESTSDAPPFRENSSIGTVARGMSMSEFADFIAGPLRMPVVDETGLKGRYDFKIDFTAYIPQNQTAMKPDYDNTNGIILAALQGELGLRLESRKQMVDVIVIDHVEKPSAN